MNLGVSESPVATDAFLASPKALHPMLGVHCIRYKERDTKITLFVHRIPTIGVASCSSQSCLTYENARESR